MSNKVFNLVISLPTFTTIKNFKKRLLYTPVMMMMMMIIIIIIIAVTVLL
jgi:hypothetical protein